MSRFMTSVSPVVACRSSRDAGLGSTEAQHQVPAGDVRVLDVGADEERQAARACEARRRRRRRRGRRLVELCRAARPAASYAGANRQNGKVFMTIDGGNYVCSGTAVTPSVGRQPRLDRRTLRHRRRSAEPSSPRTSCSSPATTGARSRRAAGRSRCWTRRRAGRRRAPTASRTTSAPRASQNAGAPDRDVRGLDRHPPDQLRRQPDAAQRLVAIGYPAAGKFNGSQQHACASPFRRVGRHRAARHPMQISCDMTGGSSGGGWFLDANGNSVADAGETLVSEHLLRLPEPEERAVRPVPASTGQAQALYNSHGLTLGIRWRGHARGCEACARARAAASRHRHPLRRATA